MIVGYILVCPDNDSEMNEGLHTLENCPECDLVVNWNYSNPNCRVRKRRYDVSYTTELCAIVSQEFRDYCVENEISGCIFNRLTRYNNLYHMQVEPSRTVSVCDTKYDYNYGPICATCNRHKFIYGLSPLFLNQDTAISPGFHYTDLFFGDGPDRQPLILVSSDTKSLLDAQEFYNLTFEPVYSRSTEYLGGGKVGDE